MSSIAANLQAVKQRIESATRAAGRPTQSVRLLAVSKTFPPAAVREAARAGVRDFGGNYVQEGVEKILGLSSLGLTWHFIGPIQSNKTRAIAEHFDWVHSVDREKIAARLAQARGPAQGELQVCIQVNVSGEATKSGVDPAEAAQLAKQVAAFPGLERRGLMWGPEPPPAQAGQRAASKSGIADNANLAISIAAGVRLANLSKWLKGHTRLVRAMPNTPAMIGEGVTGLYPFSKAVNREDREQTETILGAVGATVWLTDESQMDAVTAISGSGPAYVFYFIEAVEDAARELGLPVQIAHQLVLNTFTGAAKLASSSPDPVAVLRERVTSKGGTTERALASMAKDEGKAAGIRAIHAANERGKELGEELGKE